MTFVAIGETGHIWRALAMTPETTATSTLKNKLLIMIKIKCIEICG
jgi:hypothetical protein